MSPNRTGLFENLLRSSSTSSTKLSPSDDLTQSDDEELSEQQSFMGDLERVGKSASFTMPQLPSFSLFKDKSDDNIDQQISQIFNKRRDQLTEFINDLTSGFSIQNALDRLQLIRDVVQNTVELPVSDDDYLNFNEETEPHGVVPLVEKQAPIIDDLIIPQQRKKSKSITKYNYLTDLTADEFQDESLLRSRIKKILSLQNVPDNYKNKLIQNLMMRSYHEKIRQVSSSKVMNLKLTPEDNSSDSDISSNDQSDDADEDEVVLTTQDLIPSFHSKTENIYGCQHYQRNCKLECAICNKWYPCRFCHDQEITSHQLPRNKTKHVLCMLCSTPQLPSQICVNESCGEVLSHYYCDKCKLYDNDLNKDIYHCDDCGICRLGQGLNEDFFHCKGCNACISIDLQDHHKCIENSTHSNCTICGEYMFSSIKTVVFMQCGHPIHQSCFDEFTKHSYKCPICSRSIVNMELQFRVLDQEISLQPLPEPYGSWKCVIQCNDCKLKSMVPYHILGLKCENCKSYNTTQLKVLKNEQELKDLEEKLETKKQDEFQTLQQLQHRVFESDDEDPPEEKELEMTNFLNNDTLKNFDKYKEWFFSTMDNYLNQIDFDLSTDFNDDDEEEEDDYDDMR